MVTDPRQEAEILLELTAQIDHEEPDFRDLDEAVEAVSNPWEVLKDVLRRAHQDHL